MDSDANLEVVSEDNCRFPDELLIDVLVADQTAEIPTTRLEDYRISRSLFNSEERWKWLIHKLLSDTRIPFCFYQNGIQSELICDIQDSLKNLLKEDVSHVSMHILVQTNLCAYAVIKSSGIVHKPSTRKTDPDDDILQRVMDSYANLEVVREDNRRFPDELLIDVLVADQTAEIPTTRLEDYRISRSLFNSEERWKWLIHKLLSDTRIPFCFYQNGIQSELICGIQDSLKNLLKEDFSHVSMHILVQTNLCAYAVMKSSGIVHKPSTRKTDPDDDILQLKTKVEGCWSQVEDIRRDLGAELVKRQENLALLQDSMNQIQDKFNDKCGFLLQMLQELLESMAALTNGGR